MCDSVRYNHKLISRISMSDCEYNVLRDHEALLDDGNIKRWMQSRASNVSVNKYVFQWSWSYLKRYPQIISPRYFDQFPQD